MNPPSIFTGSNGLAGYMLDMIRIARFRFSNPHSYTKFQIINATRKRTGARTFVETGTYRGVTAGRAASVFEEVLTIELDELLANKATDYLSRRKNVKVIQGDAAIRLPEILEDKNVQDALVFLDGHFSEADTACGELPEPAVEELKTLARYRDSICAIIIDDVRCFGTNPGYPEKSDLLKSAEVYFAEHGYSLELFLDQLIICRHAG